MPDYVTMLWTQVQKPVRSHAADKFQPNHLSGGPRTAHLNRIEEENRGDVALATYNGGNEDAPRTRRPVRGVNPDRNVPRSMRVDGLP